MSRERLQHLITVLRRVEKYEERILDMNVWYRPSKVPEGSFSACALGWASLDITFRKQGLTPSYVRYEDGKTRFRIPIYQDGSSGYIAAERFFGLSENWARYIFDPTTYPAETTVSSVIDRISHVLQNYFDMETA